MQKKQALVVDIGSSKITALIGERGINGTFIIKSREEYLYEGYSDRVFFDVDSVKNIFKKICALFYRNIKTQNQPVYIGIPGEFTDVFIKDGQISFSKKKKINDKDVNDLFDAAFLIKSQSKTLINRSAVVYEVDDNRRLSSPIGAYSELLKGKLSFVVCDNYIIDIVKEVFNSYGFNKLEFVSEPLAEALYLLDSEIRDRVAILVDVGYISSTFSLIQGDGILYQKSFPFGGGYITGGLLQKFNIEDFDVAELLKRKVNICSSSLVGAFDLIDCGNGNYYESEKAIDVIKLNLDNLCEYLSDIIDESGYVIPESVPIFITGGGISMIRGAKEHVLNRLGANVYIIAPKVPLMDKPTESSILSVLNLSLEQ